ncbi:MAG TPA: signal recognition particle-docking protein FtsY [Actinobacteria bacterium]|nr:signal recognition particle-docking protein FtsY [Actinomycetota bacterium]
MLDNLKGSLRKSREGFAKQISSLFGASSIDESFWDEMEEILIRADVGIHATTQIIDKLKMRAKERNAKEAEEIKELFKSEMVEILTVENGNFINEDSLNVLLLVGVNGVGKTTTIAKMAYKFIGSDKKVLLAAADTFRAAAIEQLQEWGKRLGADVVRHQRGGDPAAVVFDAISAARARNMDILLVDTAGRLHTNVNLMEELKKIKRVVLKELHVDSVKIGLVVDATSGQNAISQARLFNDALGLDFVVLTKLDGTAKGGIVVAIEDEFKIPIWLIGTGEGLDDLRHFNPQKFVEALFG